MTLVLSGLLLGLVGSAHCAVMCGPLVAYTMPPRSARGDRWAHGSLYHAGRVAVYATLGAMAGTLGQAAAWIGFERAIAVLAGLVLLTHALFAARPASTPGILVRAAGATSRLVQRARAWTLAHRLRGPVVAGLLNGLLPCGLIYSALAAAVGLGDGRQSLLFMLAFGLGTVPALALSGWAGSSLFGRAPAGLRRLAPLALAGLGVLLVVRGVTTPASHAHRSMPAAVHSHGAER